MGWVAVNVPRSSPSSPDRGRLIVLSGPSGVGKSSIIGLLAQRRPFRFSVSVTTRPPRPGEQDGVDYLFRTRDEFERLVETGQLLEWAEFGGHLYGTPRAPVEEWLAAGDDVLLDIEIDGARQIRRTFPTALFLFVAPPGLEELRRRLEGRGDTSQTDVRRRLERAQTDLRAAPEVFDAIVVNRELDRAVAMVDALIGSDGRVDASPGR